MRIDGGEMVVRALKQQGVKEAFGLSGGHLDPIFMACERNGVRLVDTRHEAAAAHMADGYARATGRPGVCIVTAGPGTSNAVTGIANAWLDAIPLICIAGRSPITDDDRMPLQGLDQVAMMQPITKFARTVLRSERIPEYIATAWRHATSGRPGPVFIDLPIDVVFTELEEEVAPTFVRFAPEGRPAPTPADVDRMLEILATAERPVILAGGGALFSGAQKELREFAELARIPVLSWKARGIVSERTDLGFGGFGHMASPVAIAAAGGGPDVVLLLGARLGMYTGSSGGRNRMIPASATKIQVDIEAEEIGRCEEVDFGIVADVRETLRLLNERGRSTTFRDHERWIAALNAARQAQRTMYEGQIMREGAPIHQGRLARELAGTLTGEDVLVVDGGETGLWMGDQASVEAAGRWISHGYLGCIGTGIPFGIAAKIANPDRRVLVLTGDGSVGFNFLELETALRQEVPIVVVVNNDEGWGMVRHLQRGRYQKTVGAELGAVRYDLAAAGFGAYAELVTEPGQIRPAVERAFASGRAALINVMTDAALPHPYTVAMTGGQLPYYGNRSDD
jgi:acetolactate synthase-1/2/3 large subunit